MKKVVFVTFLVIGSYLGFSQDEKEASVEKSVFGIQVGVFSFWGYNELKLTNQVVLRSEIGVGGVNSGSIGAVIAVEPRWYYNLKRRANKGKRIDGNSGNYFSLRGRYHVHSMSRGAENSIYYLLVAPTWGIRRNIGKHFNYEAGVGAGLGFGYEDDGRSGISTIPYVVLGIGYRF